MTLGVATINSYGQTPCVNGFAGQYPCNGYDLMSHVPLNVLSGGQNVGGNDIWGWTDPDSGKEYAIVGYTAGTAFVDISDPINPVYLGKVVTETFETIWRDIKVYNNHAFIVADAAGEHGMQVFDLTRLRGVSSPQTFEPDHVYHGVPSCHNIVINESQPFAYLVGCDNYNGGPTIIDISNPLAPFEVGGFGAKGYTHDAQVVTYTGPDQDYQGKQILVASNGNFGSNNHVVFLDVTDGSNPVFISEISYNAPGYTHQGWLTESQDYFILGDEIDEMDSGNNTRTIVFDVKDLDNPEVHSTYFGPTAAIDHNGYVRGNKFYLANYTAGLRVIDISNIDNPNNGLQEIAYFDSYPGNNFADFDGVWSVYPYFESNILIINDMSGGLFVLKESENLGTNDLMENSIQIIPNPATSFVQIKSTNKLLESVQLINLAGQQMFSKNNINQTNFQMDVSNLPKGVYIVKVNNMITKKLLVK